MVRSMVSRLWGGAALFAVIGLLVWAWLSGQASDRSVLHAAVVPSETPKIVPWLDVTPTSDETATPIPVPKGAYPCEAAVLDVAVSRIFAATGGQLSAYLYFGNHSTTVCTLTGQPGLHLVMSSGQQIAAKAYRQPTAREVQPVTLLPHHGLRHLVTDYAGLQAGQAALLLGWDSNRDSCPYPSQSSAILRFTLPSNGALLTFHAPIPVQLCQGRLQIGAFQPIVPMPPPTPEAPAYRVRLVALPPTAVQGETIHFRAELTNISAVPLTFPATCPAYVEALTPSDHTERTWYRDYVLNCTSLRSVTPGGTRTFAMEFPVPPRMRPGTDYFSFRLLWPCADGWPCGDAFVGRMQSTISIPLRVTAAVAAARNAGTARPGPLRRSPAASPT